MIVVHLGSRAVEKARDPSLPAKRYYTLREVCHAFRLPSTTLRHWERNVQEIRAQRRGGRLFFQHDQLDLLAKFKLLVVEGGMTLEGARRQLVFRARGSPPARIAAQLSALQGEVRELIEWLDAGAPGTERPRTLDARVPKATWRAGRQPRSR